MINKNKFSIKNTKKVLHKVGKQWVVVSAVLLGLVAGGAAVNETANADTTAQAAQPNAAQQEVSQAPSSNASNVTKPASKTTLDATAAPATTARLGGIKGKATNAKTEIKNFYGKGLVTDAENEVNNYIKPSSNASTHAAAATAYNDLINNASANSIESYVNNGAALGKTTDTVANGTWLGEFNQAVSDANAIHSNNPTNPRVTYRLAQLNHLYTTDLSQFSFNVPVNDVLGYLGMSNPVSINYNYNTSNSASNPLLKPVYYQLNSVINSKMAKLNQLIKLPNVDLSQFANVNSVNSKLSLLSIPKLPTKLSLPNITYKDLLNIDPYVNGNLNINGKLTVKVAPNTTVADILNSKTVPLVVSGGNVSADNIQAGLTANPNGLINTGEVTLIQKSINSSLSTFKSQLEATITGIQSKESVVASMEPQAVGPLTTLETKLEQVNSQIPSSITDLQQRVHDGINGKLPQNLSSIVEGAIQQHNTIPDISEPIDLPDISHDNAIYLANFLDNNDGNGKSGNMYQNALATEVNKRSDQSKVREVAAGLRAIYEIMNNPTVQKGSTMKQDYDNILHDLKELPTVNENKAATDLATNSNKLADQFDNQSISGDKEYNHKIVNFLRNVAKNATNGKNNNVPKPQNVADVIDFIDSNNKVVKSVTTGKGAPNTTFTVHLDDSLPTGYQLTNPEDATVTLKYDGATHDFNVTANSKKQDTDYIDFSGDSLANTTVTGTDGTNGSVNAPDGYHFTDGSNGQFTFDNGTHRFNVAADSTDNGGSANNGNSSFNPMPFTPSYTPVMPAEPTTEPATNTNSNVVTPTKPVRKNGHYVNVDNNRIALVGVSRRAHFYVHGHAVKLTRKQMKSARVVSYVRRNHKVQYTLRVGKLYGHMYGYVKNIKPLFANDNHVTAYVGRRAVRLNRKAIKRVDVLKAVRKGANVTYTVKLSRKGRLGTIYAKVTKRVLVRGRHAIKRNRGRRAKASSVYYHTNPRLARRHVNYVHVNRNILIHTNKSFTKRNAVRSLRRGSAVPVKRIVRDHGATRFVLVGGGYITARKGLVKLI